MADMTIETIFYQGDDQRRMDYTPSGAAVVNGQVVDMGGDVGICTSPEGIADGKLGSLATDGVFLLKKLIADAITFAQGADVFWDTVNRKAVTGAGAGIIRFGKAAYAAASGDNHVKAIPNADSVQS